MSRPSKSTPEPDIEETKVGAAAPVSPVAALNRPARPAWQPMEVRSSPGVTVFGTRLTYRQAAIGAGILLLALILIITLIAQAVGGDGGDKTKDQAGAPLPSTPATTQGSQPAAAATQPSTTPSTTPSKAASSAPATANLPAGWELRTIGASGGAPAMVLPLPKNASQSGGGEELRFRWNNRLLIVGRTGDPQPDAFEDWQNQEDNRRGGYSSYQRISLKPVQWRGFKSVADWEYTYRTDSGNPQHVMRRNILVNDHAAYSLNWYVSPEDWAASQSDLQAIYQGFQPK